MIHVCYALRDESGRYSKFVGTSMLSLFENTKSEVTIHLIHDSTLSVENRSRFIKIVDRFNQQIIFYNVDDLAADSIRYAETKLPETKNFRGTIASMYRLLIPKILPKKIEHVIYIDADTIVNLDIAELWNIDLGNFSIAASPQFLSYPVLDIIRNGIQLDSVEIDSHDYFNAGVLVIDLNSIRSSEGKFFENCVDILQQNPRNTSLDQDALNIMFKDNFFKLPVNFNHIVTNIKYDAAYEIANEIYHYVGNTLSTDLQIKLNRLWFEYFLKTPFFDSKSFKNLVESFDSSLQNCAQKLEDTRAMFLKALKLTADRRRVFLVYPADEELIFEIFGRAEDDIVINAMRNDALSIILQMFQRFRGVMILFIYISPEFFPDVREILLSNDLQMNEDFFNVFDLILSQRGEFNGNKVIRAM